MLSHQEWRLIEDGNGKAAWNMAVDEALLWSVIREESAPVLRFYGWDTPSISLGRFQSVQRTMLWEAMTREGIAVVRRITGGRGILHGDDLTISLACPIPALQLPEHTTILSLYDTLALTFQQALASIGIIVCQGIVSSVKADDPRGDCFTTISRADLVDQATGIKLLGSALHRVESVLLMQASLPLHSPFHRTWVQRLGRELFRGSNTSGEISIQPIDRSIATAAITQAFVQQFGIRFISSEVTETEEQSLHERIRVRYGSAEWTLAAASTLPSSRN